jgi:hypothetical protein
LTELRDNLIDKQKEVLVESKKKNIIEIEIKCPVLELPFSNNKTHFSPVEGEEKWSIKMGDFSFTNKRQQQKLIQNSQSF